MLNICLTFGVTLVKAEHIVLFVSAAAHFRTREALRVKKSAVSATKTTTNRPKSYRGHFYKFVFPAKAGIQMLDLTGFPLSRERRNHD